MNCAGLEDTYIKNQSVDNNVNKPQQSTRKIQTFAMQLISLHILT